MKDLNYIALRSDTHPQSEHEIFIADSGASAHLTGSIEGITNLKELQNVGVTVSDGTSVFKECHYS